MTQYIVKYKTVSSVKTRYALNAQENNGGKEKESLRYSDNRNLRHVRNPRQFRVGHSRRSTDAHRDEQTEHAVTSGSALSTCSALTKHQASGLRKFSLWVYG